MSTPTQVTEGLIEIGNPIKLNYKTDPAHRITNKVRNFMTWVDLLPVNWNLNLKPLFGQQDPNNPNKGGIGYEFESAMADYRAKCKLYGLTECCGLRVVSTADTIAQEEISNNYNENSVSKWVNKLTAYGTDIRDLMKSSGSTPGATFDKFRNSPENKDNIINKGLDFAETQGGQYGKAGLNLLLSGRQISLPEIWTGTSYTPSISLNVRLISPYGSSKSIQKHVLEPLVYLLLMASPKTNDGITYGGNTFLKVKAYGITDINLGAITAISIKRGGSDVTYNKFNQPLFVDVSITIKSLLPGFACLEKGGSISPTLVDSMQDISLNNFKPIPSDFGFVTVDNIIRSFQKFTGSSPKERSILSLLGTAGGGIGAIKNMSSTIAGGIATAAGAAAPAIAGIAGAVGLATQAASVVSTVQGSITSTIKSLTLP